MTAKSAMILLRAPEASHFSPEHREMPDDCKTCKAKQKCSQRLTVTLPKENPLKSLRNAAQKQGRVGL